MRNGFTKVVSIISVLVMILCFVACGETAQQKTERLWRQKENAQSHYNETKKKYDDLQKQLSKIQSLQDALDNAKNP